MDLEAAYEISRTVNFVQKNNFSRVALQFPDEQLKDAVKVVNCLREKISKFSEPVNGDNLGGKDVELFIMADATYASCCVDEVGAAHIDADCVVHYGHTCLSRTSGIPALYVFGKATIDIDSCAECLLQHASTSKKPTLILYGLEYAYSIPAIQKLVAASCMKSNAMSHSELLFARVTFSDNEHTNDTSIGSCMFPLFTANHHLCSVDSKPAIGGLIWDFPNGCKMDDYSIFWIGSDGSAFSNMVITFSNCEIVRYDAVTCELLTDLSHQRRIIKRRYYLVEKAKDANVVGILVGTLGVAGYLDMIHKMKELIIKAGKRPYTLVMGRPNPEKLANFPECDVFVHISCPQTALLDSKELLAPLITPFEAMLAFNRGYQWNGACVMQFWDLFNCHPPEDVILSEEARFSFIQGRYVEDLNLLDDVEEDMKSGAKSAVVPLAKRSFVGLPVEAHSQPPEPYLKGRDGRASSYGHETGITF